MSKKTALFSVSDFTGITGFAKTLVSKGWRIIATEGACALLRLEGIDAMDVADFVGISEKYKFPPTLHPKMESALTDPEYEEQIELVYDVPYTLDVGNDVGGRTLLALAGKGGRIPVIFRSDMECVIEEIEKNGDISPVLRKSLIDKTNCMISAHYLELVKASKSKEYEGALGQKAYELANGENPYQVPAYLLDSLFGKDELALGNFRKVSGCAPCFTNMADLDCIVETICRLASAFKKNFGRTPYIAVAAKHGNPCGAAVDWKKAETAVEKALWGSPFAVWGGEFIANFRIDGKLAGILFESAKRKKLFGHAGWMLDVVAAPGFEEKAKEILGKREQRKLFVNKALAEPFIRENARTLREVRGGFLSQPNADYIIDLKELKWGLKMSAEKDLCSALISWVVSFTSSHGGNEIALSKDMKLIGAGGGPSTVDAARVAVSRAKANGHGGIGSVFAADAFFPYIDAPQMLARAGCKGGVVAAGGKIEPGVTEFFRKKKIAVGLIPGQYRGFCRH